MKISIIFILFLFNAIFYPALADDGYEKAFARMAFIDKFVNEAPLFIKGKSLDAFRSIGEIQSEDVKTAPNKHNPSKIDEFRLLKFDGLEIVGYVSSPEIFWPIKITVTDQKWKILNDLNIGSLAQLIYDVLGRPTKQHGSIIEYHGEIEEVIFQTDKGIISKIVFHYYVD